MKADSKLSFVRTTILEKIVQDMAINVGDILDWEMIMQGGRKIVTVTSLISPVMLENMFLNLDELSLTVKE